MKVYSLEHDEYNIKIVYTTDVDTEYIYKCDDTIKFVDDFMFFLRNPSNQIDEFIEDSIKNDIIRFSKTRKITESEKNEYFKKANFYNL